MQLFSTVLIFLYLPREKSCELLVLQCWFFVLKYKPSHETPSFSPQNRHRGVLFCYYYAPSIYNKTKILSHRSNLIERNANRCIFSANGKSKPQIRCWQSSQTRPIMRCAFLSSPISVKILTGFFLQCSQVGKSLMACCIGWWSRRLS